MKRICSEWSRTAEERESFRRRVELCAGCPAEQAVFLDIETTGFSRLYDSVYLVGLLYERQGRIWLEQLLLSDIREEPELLLALQECLAPFSVMITYNGDAFDRPFLAQRASRLCVGVLRQGESVDMLKRYRSYSAWFGWSSLKLKNLERFLGVERRDEFDGGQLIPVFQEYTRTEDEGLERLLLLHNAEDVQNLPRLLQIEEFWREAQQSRVSAARLQEDTIWFTLDRPLPLTVEGHANGGTWRCEAGSCQAALTGSVTEASLRYYLPNYKDYYYIPAKEQIVHRSLADTIPRSERRAATQEHCWLPRNGCFWPGRPEDIPELHSYRQAARDKAVYYEISELQSWMAAQGEERLTQWFHRCWN